MQRLDFLDSLRGLAAVYIVLYHIVFIPQLAVVIVPQWAALFARTGGTAVTLFFVASAFLLCLTWHHHDPELHQITYRFIEKPGIRLGKRFIQKSLAEDGN